MVGWFEKEGLIVVWFNPGVPRREVGGLIKLSGMSFQLPVCALGGGATVGEALNERGGGPVPLFCC